jgi:uncharacterized protein YecE (DUF72 family)
MDFGHLHDVRAVNFALPPLTERSQRWLAGTARAGGLRVHIGCPIWAQKEWVGSVYPRGAKASDFLALYSAQFDCIELNPTHYQMPDEATIRRWRETTATGFRFCPKFLQSVSHAPDLRHVLPEARLFVERIARLEGKLGLSFFQLPPHFSLARLPELRMFLQSLACPLPLALEFRHPTFFDGQGSLVAPVLDCLESLGLATVITDVAGRRDVSHQSLTSSRAMLRFVGNAGKGGHPGLHPSDLTRLDDWAARIAEWSQAGLADLYFMAHEPDNVLAPELVAGLIPRLARHGLEAQPWVPVSQLPGAQMGLFG